MNKFISKFLNKDFFKKLLCKSNSLWIIAILILLIPIFIFLNKTFDSDITKIKEISNSINKTNKTLSAALTKSSLDSSKALNLLTQNIESLNSIKENLNDFKPKEKYTYIFDNVELALNCNIQLCDGSIKILKNPSSKDLNISLENIITLLSETNESYKKCSNSYCKIDFKSSGQAFFDSLISYTNELIKINRDKFINSSNNHEFLMTLDEYLNKFKDISEDLMPAIKKCREDSRDISNIITDVDKKIKDLTSLKHDFKSISIPKDGIECFNLFNETLDSCDTYLSSLSTSLKDEQSFKRVEYSNPISDYSELQNKLNKFSICFDTLSQNK